MQCNYCVCKVNYDTAFRGGGSNLALVGASAVKMPAVGLIKNIGPVLARSHRKSWAIIMHAYFSELDTWQK